MAEETPDCPGCARRDREIAELKAEMARLRAMVEELQRSVKRQTAPFSKGEPKANPKTPGRKPGADYGDHASRESPSHIDEAHRARLPDLSECCGAAVRQTGEAVQYQAEIVRRTVQRRFDIEVGCCSECGKRVQGRHPLQTSDALGAAANQLGAEAKALAVHLNKDLGLSYGKVQRFFRMAFGLSVSRGGACKAVLKAADRARPCYREIERTLRRSRRIYPDGTGWKVSERLQWLWVFVARRAVLYRIRPSRGGDVVVEVLGQDWSGEMGHDGWAPYDAFERAIHQQCLGHLFRRCEGLLKVATRGAVRFPRAVKAVLKDSLALRERRDQGEVSVHGVAVATGRLQVRLDRLLIWTKANAVNERFAKHLFRHRDQIFTFLKRPGLEATNWPAEQAIRPAVVNRKVWGGNRTERGARAQEILVSTLQTCAIRGHDSFDFLVDLLQRPAYHQPLLIPT